MTAFMKTSYIYSDKFMTMQQLKDKSNLQTDFIQKWQLEDNLMMWPDLFCFVAIFFKYTCGHRETVYGNQNCLTWLWLWSTSKPPPFAISVGWNSEHQSLHALSGDGAHLFGGVTVHLPSRCYIFRGKHPYKITGLAQRRYSWYVSIAHGLVGWTK